MHTRLRIPMTAPMAAKKKKSKKTAKKSASAMDYIVGRLKKNPKTDYGSIKEGAEKKGLSVYPVMYGRAQLLLGIVKAGDSKARKKKKKAGAKNGRRKAAATRGRAARGRGARAASGDPMAAVQALVKDLQTQERTNRDLRAALERVRDMIDRVL